MKLLIEDNKGNNLLVDGPYSMPLYAIGTEVEVVTGYDDDGKIVENGVVVGYKVLDIDGEVERSYYVQLDDTENPFLVEENDVDMYYPSTNEFELNYYLNKGDE